MYKLSEAKNVKYFQTPQAGGQHTYRGFTAYRYHSSRPFRVVTPNGVTLYFNFRNEKGWRTCSFAEICRLIDGDRLAAFYGQIGDGGDYRG